MLVPYSQLSVANGGESRMRMMSLKLAPSQTSTGRPTTPFGTSEHGKRLLSSVNTF